MAKSFGRDEMNALIGGGEEMAVFRQSTLARQQQHTSKRHPKEELDYSTLSAAETAALLLEKGSKSQLHQPVVNNASRYRAIKSNQKKLAHHELLEEELLKQQRQQHRREKEEEEALQVKQQQEKAKDSEDDEDDDFVRKGQPTQAAVVISRRSDSDYNPVRRRSRRAYDSSSSSDDESSSQRKGRIKINDEGDNDELRRRRRRAKSSDSSSDDNQIDDRRHRVLASRRRAEAEPAVVILKDAATAREQPQLEESEVQPKLNTASKHNEPTKATKSASGKPQPNSDSSSSSSSGSSSEGSSDSSSGGCSDSSGEEEISMPRVAFIPKHKRNLLTSEEQKWEEEENKLLREKEHQKKRKMQSRALVAKKLAEVESFRGEEEDDDEAGGATNAMPNDDDDIDQDKEYNAWELRELGRLLRGMDEANKRRQEEEEYQKRKNMTDAQCLEEDVKLGRFQAPGANRQISDDNGGTTKHLQRFYHRGAYYMDESEWGQDDVRQKAVEYARAATGEDKIDKSKLPEVMQVKGFGRARQNQKYKGLVREDTTDKFSRSLPLVHGSKRNKN
jgi:microfibrillar-associated protein 1